MKSISGKIWVAFDFDGTLTRRDTLVPFLRMVLGTVRLGRTLALEAPCLTAYAAKLVANTVAKERLLRRALGGLPANVLQERGNEFAEVGIPRLLRPVAMERLRQHLSCGHRCVLVTASLTVYTEPWARSVGFTDVIGSELQFDESGRATGRLVHGNCYGPEKATRLRAYLSGMGLRYAYGDSNGDREMLAMAEHAIWLGWKGGYEANLSSLNED